MKENNNNNNNSRNIIYVFTIGTYVICLAWLLKQCFPNISSDWSDILNTALHFFTSFILITLPTLAIYKLAQYYFMEGTSKENKVTHDRIGYDLTRLLSWLFSANGLLSLITCAIVSLIIFVIVKGVGTGGAESQLVAITLSVSLATIIPSFISKILAKGEIESIIDEKINKALDNFNTSLYNIRRDKAHASRMSAVLLYQMASQQKETALKENYGKEEHFTNAIKNAAWSIGWASDAIIQYLLIKEKYDNAIKRSEELITDYITKSYECIKSCRDNSTNPNLKIVRLRDLTSLLTMHALIRYYHVFRNIKNDNKDIETILTDIEAVFYDILEFNEEPAAHDCGITGMNSEFNNEIRSIAEDIILAAKLNKDKNKKERKREIQEKQDSQGVTEKNE